LNEQCPSAGEPADRPLYWEASRTFLNNAVACVLAGSAVFVFAIFVLAPDQTARALGPASMSLVAATAWALLARGRIAAAVYVFALGLWAAVTGIAFFTGGVRGMAIIVYPQLILLLGWLVGTRAAVAMAALAAATTFGFALAESLGFLPLPPPTPPTMRWIVQSFVFAFSVLLIVYFVRSYQERLSKARKLGSDLAQRITEIERTQEALANINEELDARVKSRTAELEHANQALQHSNMELQRFAYVVSHDLKTPLRSISGFTQLLQKSLDGKLDAQSDDWMRRIVAGSQRMHRMLEDALSYAEVDSRAQPFERVELSEACHAALGSLRESVDSSGALVRCEALPAVLGDTRQLAQLFQNLIGNAIMYCGDGVPKIEISARNEDAHHVISVSDRGIGIEAEHQPRIFDMFYRLHAQQFYPGTGIGLAVCQRIVHRHRGRIWVESEPGKGSTFSFSLPMTQDSHDAPR
jgi:signal transduction histidine kinase